MSFQRKCQVGVYILESIKTLKMDLQKANVVLVVLVEHFVMYLRGTEG